MANPEYEWILCKRPTMASVATTPQIALLASQQTTEVLATGGVPFPGLLAQGQWPTFFQDEPLVKVGIIPNAKNRTFQLTANRAGSASFSIHTSDDMAAEILNYVDLNDIRGTVRHCIRIRRNKRDLWSGPIWGIDGDLDGGMINISCVGWLETLQHRIFWLPYDYSNNGNGFPPDEIAFDMLGRITIQDINHPPYVMPGSIGGIFNTPDRIRNRFYTRGDNLGQKLQELSDIENGFDYEVDPATRRMNILDPNFFQTHFDVKFGYNWGPRNLKNVQWQEDASKTCNYMSVQSQGSPVLVEDSTSMDIYGLFEENNTLTSANQDILVPYGMAELAIRARPFVVYNLTPQPYGPRLFDDFQIRDEIFFTAYKDNFRVENQAVRIFGATVSIDDAGNETISQLQTTASG